MKGFIYPKRLRRGISELCHVQFPLCWLWPGVLIYYFMIWPETGGDEFEKLPLHYVSFLGWEFDAKPVFFFNIVSGDPHFDALIIGL